MTSIQVTYVTNPASVIRSAGQTHSASGALQVLNQDLSYTETPLIRRGFFFTKLPVREYFYTFAHFLIKIARSVNFFLRGDGFYGN